jgi:hypothetical protein
MLSGPLESDLKGVTFRMFIASRRKFYRIALAGATMVVAVPAQALTLEAVAAEAQHIAQDALHRLGSFSERLWSGDMLAIQAAAFGACAIIAVVGLGLLVRTPPVEEEATEEAFIEHQRMQVQPLAGPSARLEGAGDVAVQSEAERSVRLLEAVAAAKAQYEIGLAERRVAAGSS